MLPRYESGPPSIKLTAEEEQTLRGGGTVQQAIMICLASGMATGSAADGDSHGPRARRLLMVKDVAAPQSIIADRLLDYDAYPRMVKGCDKIEPYKRYDTPRPGRKPLQVMAAKYQIHALHMRFTYYMVHEWDPVRLSLARSLCFLAIPSSPPPWNGEWLAYVACARIGLARAPHVATETKSFSFSAVLPLHPPPRRSIVPRHCTKNCGDSGIV